MQIVNNQLQTDACCSHSLIVRMPLERLSWCIRAHNGPFLKTNCQIKCSVNTVYIIYYHWKKKLAVYIWFDTHANVRTKKMSILPTIIRSNTNKSFCSPSIWLHQQNNICPASNENVGITFRRYENIC